MNMSKREKALLIVILLAVVATLVYLLLYQPTIRRIRIINNAIENDQEELIVLSTKQQEIITMTDQITKAKEDVAAMLGGIPKLSNEAALIRHLYTTFSPLGGINVVSIEDPAEDMEITETRMTLSFKTNYEAFKSSLEALERSEYKNRIESFSWKKDQAEGDKTVSVDMIVTFLTIRPEALLLVQ